MVTFDMDDILRMATVPPELSEPEPLVPKASVEVPTFDDLMALIQRVQDAHYGPAPDDWFEAARHTDAGETRAQAKSRIMLEEYSLSGRVVKDSELWGLRAQYVRVRQYVQGYGGGLPYDTHNWVHFYSRYGSGGAREASLMIGLRKDTVAEMGRAGVLESEARRTLRILGH